MSFMMYWWLENISLSAISVKSENILLNKGCPPEPEVRVDP